MKRPAVLGAAMLGGAAVFAVLVHAVLVAAGVAEPAGVTVSGLTMRRLWASAAVVLGVAGVLGGMRALARPYGGPRRPSSRGSAVAFTAGGLAVANGVVNLLIANGGPGTGNGVVGAAAALVLGLAALGLAAWARRRGRAGLLAGR